MDYKDYYKILGIGRDADGEELKRAYRRLARQCHPDVNPGDLEAEKQFKEINEAYQVLSDPKKRRRYDQSGVMWSHWQQTEAQSEDFGWGQWISGAPEPQVRRMPRHRADISVEGTKDAGSPKESEPSDPASTPPNFFTHLFGGEKPKSKSGVDLRLGPESKPGQQAPPEQDSSDEQEPWLDKEGASEQESLQDWDPWLEQQFWEQEGHKVWVEPDLQREWQSRHTDSSPDDQEQSTQPESAGEAEYVSPPPHTEQDDAHTFDSVQFQAGPQRGQDYEQSVHISLRQAYYGATLLLCRADQRLKINILPGTRTGVRIPVSAQGGPGIDGGKAGDLYLNVEVLPDPQFERRGDDLYVSIPVDLYTTILGGKVQAPTLGAPVTLAIPANTHNGCTFCLRNRGMPRLQQPQEYGDFYVKVDVQLPTDLGPDQIALFQRLQKGKAFLVE